MNPGLAADAPPQAQPLGTRSETFERRLLRVAPATQTPRTVIQSYVPVDLALKLRAYAEAQRSSVSAEVRHAIEDRLANGRQP